MLSNIKVSIITLCFFLVACVGEGESQKAKVSLDTQTINIKLASGSILDIDVDASFKGDGLLVGTPPEEGGLPSWLSVENTAGTSSTATFRLTFDAPQSEGSYSTVLRFLTGFENTEEFAYVDLPIQLSIISPIELAFIAEFKQSSLPLAQDLSFNASGLSSGITPSIEYLNSTLASNWLDVSETGSGYQFSVTNTDLAPNTYQALLTFESPQSEITYVQISYQVKEPSINFSPLNDITVTNQSLPQDLSFSLDVLEGGAAFDWYVEGASSALEVSKNQQLNQLDISVISDDLRSNNNGSYNQWIDIQYRLTSELEYKSLRLTFALNLDFADELAILLPQISRINITNNTTLPELSQVVNFLSGGYYTSWDIAASSNLIQVEKNTQQEGIMLNLLKDQLNTLENGLVEQWFDLNYRVHFSTEEKTMRVNFNLDKQIADVEFITPRVAYSGKETQLRIWGNNLDLVADNTLLGLQANFSQLNRISANEVEVLLTTAASNGEYNTSIANALGIDAKVAKLVVKSSPNFPISELTLPNRAPMVTYDGEREKFYYTGEGTTANAVYKIYHDGSRWYWDSYTVNRANGLALSLDANQLVVGTNDCSVFTIDLELDLVSAEDKKEYCGSDTFGLVGQFYNDLTLVADTNQWPSMYSYPNWQAIPFDMPRVHTPIGIVSQYNSHMIWAGSPTTSGEKTAYIYDARKNSMSTWGTVAGDYYLEQLFSISGRGERTAHYSDIYNSQLSHIGSLTETKNSLHRVGLSPDGTRAALFNYDTKTINLFDTSADYGPIQAIAGDIAMTDAQAIVDRLVFSEDNSTLFVFTYNSSTKISKMVVISLI